MKQVFLFLILVIILSFVEAFPANKKPDGKIIKQTNSKGAFGIFGTLEKKRLPRSLYEPFIFHNVPRFAESYFGKDTDVYRSELDPGTMQGMKKYRVNPNSEQNGPLRLGYSLRQNFDATRMTTPFKSKSFDMFTRKQHKQ